MCTLCDNIYYCQIEASSSEYPSDALGIIDAPVKWLTSSSANVSNSSGSQLIHKKFDKFNSYNWLNSLMPKFLFFFRLNFKLQTNKKFSGFSRFSTFWSFVDGRKSLDDYHVITLFRIFFPPKICVKILQNFPIYFLENPLRSGQHVFLAARYATDWSPN